MNKKILYVWDLAGTLITETWDSKRTGFASYGDWLKKKLGKPREEISDYEYETMTEMPYKKGYCRLGVAKGFKEVLSWTKHNEIFTSGVREQLNWRAENLNPRLGFDIRKYFQKINSTFDWGLTNKKTKASLRDYLEKKYREGYASIVYIDDSWENCKAFSEAGHIIQTNFPDFSYRWYHILNDNKNLRKSKTHHNHTVRSLYDIMDFEKNLHTQ